MRSITLDRPWTYRTPLKTIHYPAGEHEVFQYVADQAEAEGVIEGSSDPDGPDALDGNLAALRTEVAAIDDPAEVDRLLTAEHAGKTRKGAIEVLEARKAELSGASD